MLMSLTVIQCILVFQVTADGDTPQQQCYSVLMYGQESRQYQKHS